MAFPNLICEKARSAIRTPGVPPHLATAQNPVFMRVRRARRWIQCDFGPAKVNGKSLIFRKNLWFSAIFA
jgi:hypothetical protein